MKGMTTHACRFLHKSAVWQQRACYSRRHLRCWSRRRHTHVYNSSTCPFTWSEVAACVLCLLLSSKHAQPENSQWRKGSEGCNVYANYASR